MKYLKTAALTPSIIAMALSLGAGIAHGEEPLKLIIGTEGANPPMNYQLADGSLAGFEVEIAKALCDQMKAQCEIVAQDWDGAIPAIQSGKFDAFIASMSITEERKKQVDFSNKYFNPPPGMVALKDSDIKGVTKDDLAGKTVGVQGSTTHANYAEAYFTDSTVKAYPTSQEFKLDLVNGRLDAINDDSVTLAEWLKTPEGACCKMIGTYPPVAQYHGAGVGAAIKKGRPELVSKFNEAIKEIRINGKYKEINDKYFDFDAFGNDG